MPIRALVALLRTTPTTVLLDYEHVTALAHCGTALVSGAPALLSPARYRRFPFPSSNTPPWQVEGAVRALCAAGFQELAWLHQEGAPAWRGAAYDLNGYCSVLHTLGVPTCRDPRQLRGANLVLLPTLRTDTRVVLGGAMVCAAQAVEGMRSPARRSARSLVDRLATLQQRCAGIFAVMDGTTAGNGSTPEVRNVLLASADPVALDAVAAQLVGLDPLRDVAAVRLAHQRGLGVGDPSQIELVGDADLAHERWSFSARRPSFLANALRRVAAATPAGAAFDLLAMLYHDSYRWPYRERWVFESWLRGTEWGRLFARYQRHTSGTN